MDVAIEINPERRAGEPRILHAVVEDKVQRSGRMELRRRLLEAMVTGRGAVSWELREGRLHSMDFRQGVDLVFPLQEEEEWPGEGARFMFDLWTDEVRYLAGLAPTAEQDSGTFRLRIEEVVVPVRVKFLDSDDANRVDIDWDEVPVPVQQAAKRALQWLDDYALGHCPISPFKEQESQFQPPRPRKATLAYLPSICITALLAVLAFAAFATFAWQIVVGSFVWGMTVAPLVGWLTLNSYAAASLPDAYAILPFFQTTARRRALCAGSLITLFFAVLLLPAIVVGIWLREPEAVNVAVATFFGFMVFIWGGVLIHHVRPEPDVEPL